MSDRAFRADDKAATLTWYAVGVVAIAVSVIVAIFGILQ